MAKNLRKMRAKQVFKAEVERLVAKTNQGKRKDELLAAYVGREDELVTYLKRLSACMHVLTTVPCGGKWSDQ